MGEMTIGEVSAVFQISTRMLRYYEKMGLVQSMRRENYAYRIYDEKAVRKIQQIILLRKLQVPLKQIRSMMDGGRENAIRILEAQIHDRAESEACISTMKMALEKLLELIRDSNAEYPDYMDLVQEEQIMELAGTLPLEKHQLTEVSGKKYVLGQNESPGIEVLPGLPETLVMGQVADPMETSDLQGEDSGMSNDMSGEMGRKDVKMSMSKEMVEKGSCVRIVQLPPCTVAAYQFTGDEPEEAVGAVMDEFVRSSRLYEKKPDARLFGFNHPDPEPESYFHGYEDWVTIPDDMEVPAPLVKKQFAGGLYAAYTIQFPDFHEWQFLTEWVEKSEKYEPDYHDKSLKDMGGCLEEHLNWVYSSHVGWPENGIDGKIDLLLPIRLK